MIFDKVLDCSAEVGVDPVVLVEDGGVQRRVVSDQRRRAKKTYHSNLQKPFHVEHRHLKGVPLRGHQVSCALYMNMSGRAKM